MNNPVTAWQIRLPIVIALLTIFSQLYFSNVQVLVRIAVLVGLWLFGEWLLAAKAARAREETARKQREDIRHAVVRQNPPSATTPARSLAPLTGEPLGAQRDGEAASVTATKPPDDNPRA